MFRQTGLRKQCRPQSDCSWRSSVIRVYTVCHFSHLFGNYDKRNIPQISPKHSLFPQHKLSQGSVEWSEHTGTPLYSSWTSHTENIIQTKFHKTFLFLYRKKIYLWILLKDINSDYWKALVLSLITAGRIIKLEEVWQAHSSRLFQERSLWGI